MNFIDRLIEEVDRKKSHICVGLDPRLNQIPGEIRDWAKDKYGATIEGATKAIEVFNRGIIDAVKGYVPAVKPQIAFYEQYGYLGIRAYEETVAYAKDQGLLLVGDAKRNDIGSTAEAYAKGHLGKAEFWGDYIESKADSLTITPYLGSDGIEPFLKRCKEFDRGVFILVKTSNPSSGELQDLTLEGGEKVYQKLARLVNMWGESLVGERGYSSVGAVVGATYPQEAKVLREIMRNNYFLVPGYGAQGGGGEDVVPTFNDNGYGALVNSSRGIIFAYQKEGYSDDYKEAAKESVIAMRDDINNALAKAGKLSWDL
ncbi:orotidine-5'-phosphate decarboxylase [Halonatronum saccharophilum]|uniref:orotidine-5'-phosphate decarboxylase n=1 Tax=Halonatronum saccharophilum TaxID=150060 RepID=UPI0004899FCF|nr:orotidine-5'-phosphate decarboxylase [Halonatronum saccharophilum]